MNPDTVNITGFGHIKAEEVTGNKTLDEGDSGVAQNVMASATIAVPATVVGATYIIRIGKAGITVNVSPAAADKIMGGNLTSADNKDLIFADAPAGSYVELGADGVNGYYVRRILGTYTRET
jgi:hypothetical protein